MKYRTLTEKNGQSQYRRCKELGYMGAFDGTPFMYKIEGRKGYYCWACVRDIEAQERKAKWEHDVQEEKPEREENEHGTLRRMV